MSLTAGYDMVIELTGQGLLQGFQRLVRRGEVPAPDFPVAAPAEHQIRFEIDGDTYVARVLISDVTAEVVAGLDGGSLRLHIDFADSFLEDSDGAVRATQLGGRFSAWGPVVLGRVGANQPFENVSSHQIMVDGLTRAEVHLDRHSTTTLELVLAGVNAGRDEPMTVADIEADIAREAAAALGTAALLPLFPVDITPGLEGSLEPLRFQEVDFSVVAGRRGRPDVIQLLGMINRVHGHDDPATRDRPLVSLTDGVVICISPAAFDRYVLCPGLGEALIGSDRMTEIRDRLPPSCGTAAGVVLDDVERISGVDHARLTSATHELRDGALHVAFHVEASGTCWTGTIDVSSDIRLVVDDDGVRADASTPDVDLDLDVGFWCDVAGYYVFKGAWPWLVQQVSSLATDKIRTTTTKLLDQLSPDLPLPPGLGVQSADVRREGVVIEARVAQPGTSSQTPRAWIVEADKQFDADRSRRHTGVYTMPPAASVCGGEYQIIEAWRTETYRYEVRTRLLTRPIDVRWRLRSGGRETDWLTGAAEVSLPVQAWFPHPDHTGHVADIDAVVTVELDGDALIVRNRPEDGDYGVELDAEVVDAGGTTVTATFEHGFLGIAMRTPELDACLERYWDTIRAGVIDRIEEHLRLPIDLAPLVLAPPPPIDFLHRVLWFIDPGQRGPLIQMLWSWWGWLPLLDPPILRGADLEAFRKLTLAGRRG